MYAAQPLPEHPPPPPPPQAEQQQQQLAQLPLGAPRPPRQCAEVCLDLLLAEAVRVYASPAAMRPPPAPPAVAAADDPAATTTTAAAAAAATSTIPQVITPAPIALEAAGVRVGRAFAERLCCRGVGGGGAASSSLARPRPPGDALDAVKFVCKEFWTAAFRKQVDALRTNHRGTFVLQDNSFRPLHFLAVPLPGAALGAHGGSNAAADAADAAEQRRRARAEAAARAAQPHLWFPCGVVRGALAQLGVDCTVEADARALPACTFTVKILG